MKNLNLLFYKTYYEKLGLTDYADSLKEKNNTIFEQMLPTGVNTESALKGVDGFRSFRMKTAYPGLLVGTGYSHSCGFSSDGGEKSDNEIKLGFSFDYTTGQPYIPGSSVKGILKSGFSNKELLKSVLSKNDLTKEFPDDKYSELIRAIFGDESEEGADVFLDAVICKGCDSDGHFIGEDTITPHGDDPTKNPKPLKMIRILPDVVIEFRFILHNIELDGDSFKIEDKERLFCDILKFTGIGAKTNVGYGVLKEFKKENNKEKKEKNHPEALKAICPKCHSLFMALLPAKCKRCKNVDLQPLVMIE